MESKPPGLEPWIEAMKKRMDHFFLWGFGNAPLQGGSPAIMTRTQMMLEPRPSERGAILH